MKNEEHNSEALTVQSSAELLSPLSDLKSAQERLTQLQEFARQYLEQDVDFGTIPGTPKPSLFKAGADKLCELYGLTDTYEEIRSTIDWAEGLFDYEFRCILSRGDRVVTVGLGSCSSWESKYRWRDKQRTCPKCGKETIARGKAEYGGGWYCNKRKDGCGTKFAAEDPAITGQQVGREKNPDIWDLKNTIIKMAKKRAKVDATLSATRSSGIFGQKFDDRDEDQTAEHTEELIPPEKPASTARQPQQQQNPKTIDAAPLITEEERRKVYAAAHRAQVTPEDLNIYIREKFTVDGVMKITAPMRDDVLQWLNYLEQELKKAAKQ